MANINIDKSLREITMCQRILAIALDKVEIETDLIYILTELNLVYIQYTEKFESRDRQKSFNRLNESFEKLVDIFQNCLDSKKSIITTYGLKYDSFFNGQHTRPNEKKLFQFLFNINDSDVTTNNRNLRYNITYFKDQISNILKQRLANSSFDELVTVIAHGDITSQYLRQEFDTQIHNHLKSENIENVLELLCKSLKNHPKMLQFYTNEVIKNKWPSNKDNTLNFMIKSRFFISIHKYNLNYNVLNSHWNQKLTESLENFTMLINRVCNGDETFKVIKTLNDNREIAFEVVQVIPKGKLQVL